MSLGVAKLWMKEHVASVSSAVGMVKRAKGRGLRVLRDGYLGNRVLKVPQKLKGHGTINISLCQSSIGVSRRPRETHRRESSLSRASLQL